MYCGPEYDDPANCAEEDQVRFWNVLKLATKFDYFPFSSTPDHSIVDLIVQLLMTIMIHVDQLEDEVQAQSKIQVVLLNHPLLPLLGTMRLAIHLSMIQKKVTRFLRLSVIAIMGHAVIMEVISTKPGAQNLEFY